MTRILLPVVGFLLSTLLVAIGHCEGVQESHPVPSFLQGKESSKKAAGGANLRNLSDNNCQCSSISCGYYKYNGEGKSYQGKNANKACVEQCCNKKQKTQTTTTTQQTSTTTTRVVEDENEEEETIDVQERVSTTAPTPSSSCTCDDVTTDMCQTCYASGDYTDCCDITKCCDVEKKESSNNKWGEGSTSTSSWSSGGSSSGGGNSSGGGSGGGYIKPMPKPKPKPKPHPSKPKPKPKPKPHPTKTGGGGGSGGSSGGSGSGWGGGGSSKSGCYYGSDGSYKCEKWGNWTVKVEDEINTYIPISTATSPPKPTPTSSPTNVSVKSDSQEVCDCSEFTDNICTNCIQGSGSCPDQSCVTECCEVKTCRCSDYSKQTCKACLGNGSGSCPDVDCAEACCDSYDYTADGDSYKPKQESKQNQKTEKSDDKYTSYGTNGSNYKAKQEVEQVNQAKQDVADAKGLSAAAKFSIFALLVAAAVAAVAVVVYRTRQSESETMGDVQGGGLFGRVMRPRPKGGTIDHDLRADSSGSSTDYVASA